MLSLRVVSGSGSAPSETVEAREIVDTGRVDDAEDNGIMLEVAEGSVAEEGDGDPVVAIPDGRGLLEAVRSAVDGVREPANEGLGAALVVADAARLTVLTDAALGARGGVDPALRSPEFRDTSRVGVDGFRDDTVPGSAVVRVAGVDERETAPLDNLDEAVDGVRGTVDNLRYPVSLLSVVERTALAGTGGISRILTWLGRTNTPCCGLQSK